MIAIDESGQTPPRFVRLFAAIGVALLFTSGCKQKGEWSSPVRTSTSPNQTDREQHKPVAMQLEVIKSTSIDHLYRLSPKLYSGSQPHDETGFAELEKLGIKTIVSVDGARPDVATADRYGLRYVHLPLGYDGIPNEDAARLAKAAESLEGPIFFHCHHGQHRGPAAAAIVGIAIDGWSNDQASEWMRTVGTSPSYSGLYESVQQFRLPTKKQLDSMSAEFPAVAQLPPLTDTMVHIDRTFDHLKASQQVEFGASPEHPDLSPPHEALQLTEHFRELLRQPETQAKPTDFIQWLKTGESQVKSLHTALAGLTDSTLTDSGKPAFRAAAVTAMSQLQQTCKACHRKYRN